MINATFTGYDALFRALADFPAAIRAAVQDSAITFRKMALGNSPVGDPKKDPHYGQFKGSWSDITYEAGGWSFENLTPYGEVLDLGGYRGVGPRTVASTGGIFSRQAPYGVLSPLLADEALKEAIMNGIVDKLSQVMRGNA
jgi:hypothetical protein